MTKNGTLTAAQKRAIAALLSEKNVRAAAKVANVPERTLWRWMKENQAFQNELTTQEDSFLDQAARRILTMQESAFDVFDRVMNDATAKDVDQIRAAEGTAEYLFKLRSLHLTEKRVREMEELLNEIRESKNVE